MIKVSPEIALLMIEEGFAVKADSQIYQRNPIINFFSFRKWRKTEEYSIRSENRDKVYIIHPTKCVSITRSEFTTAVKDCNEIIVQPPIGHNYSDGQIKIINSEAQKISNILKTFLNSSSQ